MRVKSQKGSIAIFVLVALLFYMAFLLLLYANNVNKVQTITEKVETLKSIYAKNVENIDEVYNREKGIQVGDYVNYDELSNGKKTYSVDYTQNGGTSSTNNQTFETEDLGWRVLDIADNGQVTLISDNPTTATLYLRGDIGYVNSETVLNQYCDELYGKGYGAQNARSINIIDIDKISGYNPTSNSDYGKEYIYTSGTHIQEDGSKMQASTDNPVTMSTTYYGYALKNIGLETMLRYTKDNLEDAQYWIATRKVYCNTIMSYYYIPYVYTGSIRYIDLWHANGTTYDASNNIRPVVTLNSNVKLVKDTATDTWNIQ